MSLRRTRWVNGGLVIAALASSVAVALTSQSVTTSERLARERNVFRSWRPAELRQIRVARFAEPARPDVTGPSQLVLSRIDGSDDPHDFALGETDMRKADPGAVSELLAALEHAVWLRRVEPAAVDRQSFGLQEPVLEVRATLRGTDYRLIVGAEAPSPSGARYAELTGSGVPDPDVGVIAREFVEQLEVDERAFLGSQLLPYAKSELERVELQGAGGERRLVRDARGFRLGGPDGPRAHTSSVDNVLFQMARVTASRYLDLADARRALESGRVVEVTQTPRDGQPVRVRLGAPCPGAADSVIALRETDPSLAACVPATVMPALTAPEAELVDRTPFPFRPDEVDHFTVVQGDAVLEAVRSGARFDLLRPRSRALELDPGNEYLMSLVSPQGELWRELNDAQDAPDLSRLGLSPPLGQVTLRGLVEASDQAEELTVNYSKPDAQGRTWLQREDDGAVLALSRKSAVGFSTDTTWTRPRALLDVEKQAIARVAVVSAGERRVLQQSPAGALQLIEPAGFELDGGIAADWLAAVSDLHAVRWLSDRARAELRGARQPVEVQVSFRSESGEEKSLAFTVGERTTGGYLAELTSAPEQDPGFFVLHPEVLRTLSILPISRLALVPDVEHLEQLSIESPAGNVGLERRAGELVAVDGSLAPSALPALEQALAALQPLAAVHVGPPRRADGTAEPELTLSGQTRSPGGESQSFTYRFGNVGTWQGRTVQFARVVGVEATFAVDHSHVQRLLDLL